MLTSQCFYCIVMANMTNAIMYLRFIFVKLIHHMHYDELVAECLVFTMNSLWTHHEDYILCNDILNFFQTEQI